MHLSRVVLSVGRWGGGLPLGRGDVRATVCENSSRREVSRPVRSSSKVSYIIRYHQESITHSGRRGAGSGHVLVPGPRHGFTIFDDRFILP
ncbi:hypothetical protein NPIL_621801 [Nephila pilipes]|uniref:Uncharacterized protein n=1 Tax=Nephila pilipes TaxID=299642 RepID=A0A8X6R8G9_NEPPI|nr:hypothetical protein NPIL_621801 [Nephila pilipes]